MIQYAHTCSKKPLTEFSGKFKGPYCDLGVIIENNKFEAIGSFEKTSSTGGWASAFGFRPTGSNLVPGIPALEEKKTTMVVESFLSG